MLSVIYSWLGFGIGLILVVLASCTYGLVNIPGCLCYISCAFEAWMHQCMRNVA